MTGTLFPRDRAGRLLPDWADKLSRTCTRYSFSTMQVSEGRAVVATRVEGTGPLLVITSDEDEMRHALGLTTHKPAT